MARMTANTGVKDTQGAVSVPTAVRIGHEYNSLTVPHPLYPGFTVEPPPWLRDIAASFRNWC